MARKLNQYGVPELTEIDPGLEQYYNKLEVISSEQPLGDKDQVILSVCRAIGGIEGAGVFGFADQVWDLEDTLQAFNEIGCGNISAKVRFMHENDESITLREDRRKMEEEVYELLQVAADRLCEFWKRESP